MRLSLNTILIALTFVSMNSSAQRIEVRNDFKKYFDECKVSGSFSLYDLRKNKYTLYNKKQFTEKFTPASTFKICSSLIGLESGVIADENFVIKWDGVKREREAWNHDQDLKTAYKNSTVPYYQELARRVGGERMKYWLDKAQYGNADTAGGIDQFWLSGGLRISPEQQLDFLLRLHNEELPFSKRSMKIVKNIMIEEETPAYTLRTKTGMAEWDGDSAQRGKAIGWYVGYVTRGNDVFVFATCIQTPKAGDSFAASRKTITRKILANLRILPIQTK